MPIVFYSKQNLAGVNIAKLLRERGAGIEVVEIDGSHTHADWLSACKGGPAASANFEYGARLTELALLGNVALRVGKKIKWDAANMKATNAPEADAFIKENCRKGWEIV